MAVPSPAPSSAQASCNTNVLTPKHRARASPGHHWVWPRKQNSPFMLHFLVGQTGKPTLSPWGTRPGSNEQTHACKHGTGRDAVGPTGARACKHRTGCCGAPPQHPPFFQSLWALNSGLSGEWCPSPWVRGHLLPGVCQDSPPRSLREQRSALSQGSSPSSGSPMGWKLDSTGRERRPGGTCAPVSSIVRELQGKG